MTVQLPLRLDKQAFFDWLDKQDERYELVNGLAVMMVRATRRHGVIVLNIAGIIRRQTYPRKWMVFSEFGLDIGPNTLRFPDILVDRAGGNPTDYVATDPVLAIEVLSPSSKAVDLEDKVDEYLTLPSLSSYVVFAQDEPKAWIWSRAGGAFSSSPAVVSGMNQSIRISGLDLSLAFAEVYANTGIS